MAFVFYDKEDLMDTPSHRDGIDSATEDKYRKEGAQFIIEIGLRKMNLGIFTVATGVMYFHRFYMVRSFKTFPRYVTACCCLFLAGKVEETPKKCKDIIKIAKSLLTDEHFSTFGENPYEEVMTLEKILLQTIKFDFNVNHPYHFLLKYAKCLVGHEKKRNEMVQTAWALINDSLITTISLMWEPELIAIAVIHMASKMTKFTVKNWTERQSHHLNWWDMFVEDLSIEIIEEIGHKILDLYPAAVPCSQETPVNQ